MKSSSLPNARGASAADAAWFAAARTEDTLVDRRSPLTLDSAYVQQTKDQIRGIVERIARLAQSPIEPVEFVNEALPKIMQAMGANGAALWQWDLETGWQLVGAVNMPRELLASGDAFMDRDDATKSDLHGLTDAAASIESTLSALGELDEEIESVNEQTLPRGVPSPALSGRLSRSESDNGELRSPMTEPAEALRAILDAVRGERQPILIPPADIAVTTNRPKNPIDQVLLFAPLPLNTELGSYWLQVLQSPSGGPSSQRGYLRFVAQMADLLSDFFKSHQLRMLLRDQNCLAIAERTMSAISGMQARQAYAQLMNALRQHAAAEHVFLLRRDSYLSRWKVVAAAGLVDIDRNSEGIQLVASAANCLDHMMPLGGPLRTDSIDTDIDDRDPELSRWINTFAVTDCHWAKLLDEPTTDHAHVLVRSQGHRRMDVALLATWSGSDRPPARVAQQMSLIARLGLSTMQLSWWKAAVEERYQNRVSRLALLNPLAWTAWARTIASVIVLGLILAIPVPLHLTAPATLVPSEQQQVFAPDDCIVESVLIDHGQHVTVGQPLVLLRSPALSAEYEQATAQQLRNNQRRLDVENKLLRSAELSPAERDELEGERDTLTALIDIENTQIALLKKRMDALTLCSTMDGVIDTWNVRSKLKDRPLSTGQWLFSLHEPQSKWMMEAALPESDAQLFLRTADINGPLQATASLTSAPQSTLHLTYAPLAIPRIEKRTKSQSPDDVPSVMIVRFAVENDQFPFGGCFTGATGRISIPSGRAPLGWALSRDFLLSLWAKARLWM